MPVAGAAYDVNGFVPYLVVVTKTNTFEYFVSHIIQWLHVYFHYNGHSLQQVLGSACRAKTPGSSIIHHLPCTLDFLHFTHTTFITCCQRYA